MATIPERLRNATFRFVLLRAKSKIPFERGWNETANYKHDDPRLLDHLDKGGNYGVLCGINNLVVVDADHPFIKDAVNRKCPDTYDVTTGRLGTHYYFFTDKPMETIKLRDPGDSNPQNDIGHIKGLGSQVVGPDSEHENGTWYMVCHDLPIATVPADFLREALSEFIEGRREATQSLVTERREAITTTGRDTKNLLVESLVDLAKFKKAKDGYIGPHPVHGSTGGQNFHINTTDNYWYCFRCGTGGGAVSLVAILEGLMTCDQAKSGALRGELFKRTMRIGEEKYHFPKPVAPEPPRPAGTTGRTIPEADAEEEERAKRYKDERKPCEIADEILKTEKFITTDEGDIIYHYSNGYYAEKAENYIKDRVVDMSPEKSEHYANEVVYQIRAKSRVSIEEINNKYNILCVNNGLLDVLTGELTAHSPDVYVTTKIAVTYDPTADCPNFKKFLSEVIRPEDVPNIQELFGYCLLRQYIIEKAFMFVGPGGNGKGVLIHTLENFLGRENHSSVSLQDISDNRFAVAEMFGKLLNSYADLSPKAMADMGLFKMLTGRDVIKAERKHCDPFHFRNFAKMVFSANKVPFMKDNTDAIFQRWVIVDFPNTFRDMPNCDPNLEMKLCSSEEKCGILNWALEGLQRMIANKRFSNTNTTDEMRVRMTRLASPMTAYIEDNLEIDASKWMSLDELYKRYIEYATANKLPKTTKVVFSRDMPMHLPNIVVAYETVDGIKLKGWRGVRARTGEKRVEGITGQMEKPKTWFDAEI